MLHFQVSILPLITVAVANFFLSWLYYSPAVPWFKIWQKGVGMDPNKREMSAEDRKRMPLLMGGAVVATFLFSYGLQVIVHATGAVTFASGACIGSILWLCFAIPHSLNTLFEGRKVSVLVLNNILYALTYAAFGGLVAVWK